MFDYMDEDDPYLMDEDDPYLPRGVRYDGIDGRKPSAVLAAIEGDVIRAAGRAAEDGFDPYQAEVFVLQHQALLALVTNSPIYDEVLSSEDDEDWVEQVDWQTIALKRLLEDFFDTLDNYVRPYQRYGWYTDDPTAADFAEVGVYINWDEIESHIQQGIMAEIDHPDDIADMDDGVRYVIIQDGDRIEIWNVPGARMEWST